MEVRAMVVSSEALAAASRSLMVLAANTPAARITSRITRPIIRFRFAFIIGASV